MIIQKKSALLVTLTMMIHILLFISFSANAQIKGNGGDVVVCPKEGGKEVMLLDFYEATERYGWQLDLVENEQNEFEKAKAIVNRLENLDPVRAIDYTNEIETFEARTHLWPHIELEDIPDSQHIAIPAGCSIEQIAIANDNPLPDENMFTISKDLWDLLPPSHKAGLIIHEIVYKEARSVHQVNSINSRYLTGWLASTKSINSTQENYTNLIKKIGFKTNPEIVKFANIRFYKKNFYQSTRNGKVYFGGSLYPERQFFKFKEQTLDIEKYAYFLIKDNIVFPSNITLASPTYFSSSIGKVSIKGNAEFNENGVLISGVFSEPTLLQTPGGSLYANSFNIASEGYISSIGLSSPQDVNTPSGKLKMQKGLFFGPSKVVSGSLSGINKLEIGGGNKIRIIGKIYWDQSNGPLPDSVDLADEEIITFRGVNFFINKKIYWNKNGKITNSYLSKSQKVVLGGIQYSLRDDAIWWDEDGRIINARIDGVYNVRFGDQTLNLTGAMRWWDNGVVAGSFLEKNQIIKIGPYSVLGLDSSPIRFNREGNNVISIDKLEGEVEVDNQKISITRIYWNIENNYFDSISLAQPYELRTPLGKILSHGNVGFTGKKISHWSSNETIDVLVPNSDCEHSIHKSTFKISESETHIYDGDYYSEICLYSPTMGIYKKISMVGFDDFYFYPNWRLKYASKIVTSGDTKITFPVFEKEAAFDRVELYENGYVKEGVLGVNKDKLMGTDGNYHDFEPYTELKFDETGRVIIN